MYDFNSSYIKGQLRYNLCEELLGSCSDCKNQLIDFLKRKGILIVDCALCPLHLLTSKSRRIAATICLDRHTGGYLNVSPHAPIITVFPRRCGFHKKNPEVRVRGIKEFRFKRLGGLKETIRQILGS